jgi:tetratricopeptide (TPR) repeat protein
MILLQSKGDAAAALEVAKDFFATIPDAGQTLKGLAILGQQAEAQKKLGDQKGVEATAQHMIELDPRGPGGEKGRELLGAASSGSLGGVDTYRLAESAARRGEVERAIELCQQTMVLARGTAEEAKLGAQACLLLGALQAQRNWMHEAVVAWSGVTQRYAQGAEAPECLWRAANGYLALQAQERSPAFYKDGAREMMTQLTARYPEHRYASMAAIIEGQQLEAEEEFVKAADVYTRIPAGNAGHEEALYRAGNSWAGEMRKLLRENKQAEAKNAANKAEDLLKKARTTLEKAAGETLDLAAQERFRALAFNSRVSLANLYLTKGVDRAANVAALFDGAEREFSGDVPKLSSVRALRLKALQALGKVDEAALLLDQQLKEDPSGKGLGASAAILARAFDERGVALRSSNSVESESLLRKAANYYGIAIRGQISGEQAVRIEELEPIANRLNALALQSNGVPDAVESFVEWKGNKVDDPLLDIATRAYEAVLTVTPSYRTQISLSRALGFMQRWEDASESYARLFERESFVNLSSRTIDPVAMREKPELAFALLEWGVCEREIGVSKNAPDRMSRASSIFESLVVGTRKETKLWWLSEFYFVQTLSDRGEYQTADIAVRDLGRNYPEYDAGPLKERFLRLAKELEKKVPR